MRKFTSPPKRIVLHCTDSQDSLDIGAKDIRRWHTDLPPRGRGWDDIGYHYIVRRKGVIELGRSIEFQGAGVFGHNSDTIHVVWVGRSIADTEQLLTIYSLLQGLMAKYGIPVYEIYGHKELDPFKTCPNLDMNFVRLQTLFHVGAINVDEL